MKKTIIYLLSFFCFLLRVKRKSVMMDAILGVGEDI